MKEITFLKSNKEKWESFENFLKGNARQDPDRLGDLFVELTDDLSYARTYFPGSNTERYLNGLTADVHQHIYRNKKEKSNRIITFWKSEFPLLFKSCQKALLYSFIIFTISFLIGALSEFYDDSFVRIILGDSYVNMTEENIANGDPMAVYKGMGRSDMFAMIALNNIRVSFLIFIAGILFSVGTAILLFYNGVMLGAFIGMFYHTDVFKEAMYTIWIHGTIEIAIFIIAGAAGLTMGNALLFPKTYSRGVSFVKGARNGMKIIIAIFPLFLLAAFLEGFVTRETDMPDWLSLFIILGSLAFVVWYFVILPRLVDAKTHSSHSA